MALAALLTTAFYARPAIVSPTAHPLAGWSQAMNFTVEGKITEHSAGKPAQAGKLTITTGENMLFHARYDEKTEIKHRDGSAASAKEFRSGVKVRIDGDLTESGEIIAQKILIEQDSEKR